MASTGYNVCLFNSADPRGGKVGGIETYIRDYIYYHPEDMNLLFIGADEIGDLPIGQISPVTFRGRNISFLPLCRLENSVNNYPNRIQDSEGFHFASMLVKNWSLIRKILRLGRYSAELRRVEYAPVIWSMGVPFVQMVHIWGAKDAPMSGLQGKYWYLRNALEYTAAMLCYRFYAVNSDMTAMYKQKYHRFADKFDTLTTWANTTTFQPSRYQLSDAVKVFFAGRMDKFKRPDIMFQVIAEVRRLTDGKVEFHYVGDGDPSTFSEFADIADIATLHGRKNSAEIAEILKQMHIGILTSEFEGMPRVIIEVLTTGRPVVALHLPQLEPVVKDLESGFLVPRSTDQVEVLGRRIVETYQLMRNGALTPERVVKAVVAYSPQALLGKIFADHRRLHDLG
jgi:glycosyltransferase involved in cell wall biosynthesis